MMGWLRDPLLQFLLAGVVIFGLQTLLHPPQQPSAPAELGPEARRRWQEQQALLAEARRLGLDHNDSLIDRQLEQKMRRLISLRAQPVTVTKAELQAYLEQHAERYREADRYHADQVWVRRSQAHNSTEAQPLLDQAIRSVQANTDLPADLPALTPVHLEHWPGLTAQQVRKRYGEAMADALRQTPANGVWSPLIHSGLGWHRLRLQRVDAGTLPPLDQIRARVEADWRAALAEQALHSWLAQRQHD
jgi:hypothetical protein